MLLICSNEKEDWSQIHSQSEASRSLAVHSLSLFFLSFPLRKRQRRNGFGRQDLPHKKPPPRVVSLLLLRHSKLELPVNFAQTTNTNQWILQKSRGFFLNHCFIIDRDKSNKAEKGHVICKLKIFSKA